MIREKWFRYHYEFKEADLREVNFNDFLIDLDRKNMDEVNNMLDCLVNIIHSLRKLRISNPENIDREFIEQSIYTAEVTFVILTNYKWEVGFKIKPKFINIHDNIVRERGIGHVFIKDELEQSDGKIM